MSGLQVICIIVLISQLTIYKNQLTVTATILSSRESMESNSSHSGDDNSSSTSRTSINCPLAELNLTISSRHSDYNKTGSCLTRPWSSYHWTALKDENGAYLKIIGFEEQTAQCMQPGYCASLFPWYIYKKTNTTSSEYDGDLHTLCMTDSSMRGVGLCCEQGVPIHVKQCNGYTLYKITESIPYTGCGTPCTIPYGASEMTSLKASQIVTNRHALPMSMSSLSEDMISNSVTFTFSHGYGKSDRFNEVKTIDSLYTKLISNINEELLWTSRRRRSAHRQQRAAWNQLGTLNKNNIRTIVNSPVTINFQTYHTLHIMQDSGTVLDIQPFFHNQGPIKRLLHADVANDSTTYISNATLGIPYSIFSTDDLHTTSAPATLNTTPLKLYTTSNIQASTATDARKTTDRKVSTTLMFMEYGLMTVSKPKSALVDTHDTVGDGKWMYIMYILAAIPVLGIILVLTVATYINCRSTCRQNYTYKINDDIPRKRTRATIVKLKSFHQHPYLTQNGTAANTANDNSVTTRSVNYSGGDNPAYSPDGTLV